MEKVYATEVIEDSMVCTSCFPSERVRLLLLLCPLCFIVATLCAGSRKSVDIPTDSAPDVEAEFQIGHFVLHQSQRSFSGMPLDQTHEHNNAAEKTDARAIAITENPFALLMWMTCGPEIVNEYEEKSKSQSKLKSEHHEDIPFVHKCFHKEVTNLITCIEELANPFTEESGELLTLLSRLAVNNFNHSGRNNDKFYVQFTITNAFALKMMLPDILTKLKIF